MATTIRRSSSSFGGFEDGVIVKGVPIISITGGSVFWVDSNGGGGSKGTFAHPCLTLAAAMGLCVADRGDTIMIKANHSETVTGAGGITLAKNDVSIHGLGNYTARPTFLMDGDAITGLVTGNSITVTNCIFKAGHADIACAFLVSGTGFTMDSCAFTENVATENFVAVLNAGVADNDYDGLVFSNNILDFTTAEVAVLQPIECLKSSKDVSIVGNEICGDFDTTAYAQIYSVNTLHHMNCEISYNLIHNQHDANAAISISFGSTTSTGWIHHNLISASESSGSTPIVSGAGGMKCFENYYCGDDSVSAYIYPAIGTDA